MLTMLCLLTLFIVGLAIRGSTGLSVSSRFIYPSGSASFPCLPSHTGCSARCDNGYQRGPTGCYYCACADSSPAGPMSGPMSGMSGMGGVNPFHGGGYFGPNPAGNPQNQQLAHAQCLLKASDCPCTAIPFHISYPCFFCDCNGGNSSVTSQTKPSVRTTTVPTSQTTPSSTSVMSRLTSRLTSTPKQLTTPPSVIVLTTRVSPPATTSGDYCADANRLCKLTCPEGFLVDANDCTYCVCKADVIKGMGK